LKSEKQQAASISEFYDRRGIDSIADKNSRVIPAHVAAPYLFAYSQLSRHLDQGAKILDFACGTGLHSLALARMGLDVTGIDISEASIAAARSSVPPELGEKVRFYLGDQSAKELDNQTFDAIFVSGALYYLDIEQDAKWFFDHLKASGMLVGVETLGNNHLLGTYRKMRHILKNHRDEQTLNHLWRKQDFEQFGRHFDTCKIGYFDFLTLIGVLFVKLPRLQHSYLRLASTIDAFILNKLINTLSFKVVITAMKNAESTSENLADRPHNGIQS
jgi:ubiquinone/menaquinone biosynthesis C-methylase UbiE